MLPALGGPERKLYSAKYIGGLDWSSDGRTLAFATKDSENQPNSIYLLAVDSLEVSRLTSPRNGTDGDYRPAFSPDGRKVAFLRRFDRSETTDVHVVSIDGGEPRRLTFDKRQVLGLAWTPDGKSLVFSSERTGVHRLWKVPATGGEPEELGIGTENAYDPSISRTGNRLTTHQILYDTNIWRMKRTGTSERADPPVKFVSTTQRDEFPRLSPDGKKMVFESTRSGSHELWLTDSDGTNPIQMTFFGSGATSNARWSPDGRQIAFESHSEEYPNIYVIGAEGGLPRKITDGHFNSSAAGWSNDGRWIYFASNRGGTWEVWKVQALGGDPLQVTRNGGYESFESSDGQFLYYNKRGYGTVGLFRIPVSGGDEDLVFDFVQMHSNGDWVLTNDGIYFIHRCEGPGKSISLHPAIKFVDFATHNITTVVTLEKFPGYKTSLNLTSDGQWFIFASHDSSTHDIMLVENFH